MSSGSGAIPTLKTGLAHPHPEPMSGAKYSAVELMPGNHRVIMLDQRKLPQLEHYEGLTSAVEVANAIRTMVVRGAPAIGIAAAYGMVLAAVSERGEGAAFTKAIDAADAVLRAARPTAVNLAWAIDQMRGPLLAIAGEPHLQRVKLAGDVGRAIHAADVAACRAMGKTGALEIKDGATVLTHCNAGALATGGYGTALGVIRAAIEAGKKVRVIATETRPYLQGARLTAWELARDGIPVQVITDGMVAQLMAKGAIDLVVVGADRIARSGDVANKIGTYGIACLAHVHGVPFYVAAPWSTVDLACANGDSIPIEQRDEREVTHFPTPDGPVAIVPETVGAQNPAFDVTPARYVRTLFTERGAISPLNEQTLASKAP